jgi:hypothetical protein
MQAPTTCCRVRTRRACKRALSVTGLPNMKNTGAVKAAEHRNRSGITARVDTERIFGARAPGCADRLPKHLASGDVAAFCCCPRSRGPHAARLRRVAFAALLFEAYLLNRNASSVLRGWATLRGPDGYRLRGHPVPILFLPSVCRHFNPPSSLRWRIGCYIGDAHSCFGRCSGEFVLRVFGCHLRSRAGLSPQPGLISQASNRRWSCRAPEPCSCDRQVACRALSVKTAAARQNTACCRRDFRVVLLRAHLCAFRELETRL